MDQPTSAALIAGGSILLIAAGAWIQLEQRGRDARLAHFVGQLREGSPVIGAERENAAARRSPLAQRLNRALSHQGFVQRTRLDLLRAGITIRPTQFFLLRLALALLGLLLGLAFTPSVPFLLRLVVAGALAVVGYLAVRPFLSIKRQRRVQAFEKTFPDALDVMVGALESGASFNAAMELVSREMEAPLSTEFARVLRDASMGVSYENALNNLHERLPSDDLGMLVSAVSIQMRVGGNLAEVLKTLSNTVRERVRIRGEIKTLTSQQNLSAKIITGLPFLLGIALYALNRDYMQHLFDPGIPRLLAVTGLIFVGIGNFVIRRIIAIEV